MPRMRRAEKDRAFIESQGAEYLEVLARGLKIISLFNAERRQMTLSELAQVADAPRSSVRRVLLTLEKLGFAEQEGRYFKLTPRILTLAAAYLSSNSVTPVLQPIVDRISHRTQESCSAAVLDRDEAVMVVRAIPSRIITVGLEVGYRLPAYASAVGRVLLGGLDEAELDAYLARIQPEKLTPQTVTDKAVLKAMIITDRSQNYSLVDQEAEAGFRSIAVPVRRQSGGMICALHIGLHQERASTGRILDEFLPLLRAGATEASLLIV
jgi:IclR family transcriptional regulator, pca regulon regulatory protein